MRSWWICSAIAARPERGREVWRGEDGRQSGIATYRSVVALDAGLSQRGGCGGGGQSGCGRSMDGAGKAPSRQQLSPTSLLCLFLVERELGLGLGMVSVVVCKARKHLR